MSNYLVVLKTLEGPSAGVRTWSSYASKHAFDQWYAGKMADGSERPWRDVYQVCAEGVNQEQAIQAVSTESNRAIAHTSESISALRYMLS